MAQGRFFTTLNKLRIFFRWARGGHVIQGIKTSSDHNVTHRFRCVLG